MNKLLCGSLSALALLAFTSPLRAQGADPGVELAFMPRTMTVTLLNEGGKYVAIDLKHIPQGGSCRMDKDATIARVGSGCNGNDTSSVRGRSNKPRRLPIHDHVRSPRRRLRGGARRLRCNEGRGVEESGGDQEGSRRKVGRGDWKEELSPLKPPKCDDMIRIRLQFRFRQEMVMNTNTLLIIIVVLLLVGGGGFYGHGRWF